MTSPVPVQDLGAEVATDTVRSSRTSSGPGPDRGLGAWPRVLLALVAAAGLVLAIWWSRKDRIDIDAAARHIGEAATVCGRVAKVHYKPEVNAQPTFLDFGQDFPDDVFSAVIWGEDRAAFPQPPEIYQGRRLCVNGTVELFRDKPSIRVHDPGQLSLPLW